jgi:predicted ATP-dependent endonuclease of OLD family
MEIKNFQNHEHTALNFCAGVNVIVGASDSGKSAVIRALRWATENKPTGTALLANSQKKKGKFVGESQVVLFTDKGFITRFRTDSKNAFGVSQPQYITCKETGETSDVKLKTYREFEAIRGEVPKEVFELLPLSAVNWQTQFTMSYLLDMSPLEASKEIQRMCGLEDVPAVMAASAQAENQIAKAQKETAATLAEKEDALKAFAGIEAVERKLAEYRAALGAYSTMEARAATLAVTLDKAKAAHAQYERLAGMPEFGVKNEKQMEALRNLRNRLAIEEELSRSISQAIRTTAALAKYEGVEKLNGKLKILDANRATTGVVLQARQKLGATMAQHPNNPLKEAEFGPLLERVGACIMQAENGLKHAQNRSRLNAVLVGWDGARVAREKAEKEHAELVAQMPKTCPLCGNQMEDGLCHD